MFFLKGPWHIFIEEQKVFFEGMKSFSLEVHKYCLEETESSARRRPKNSLKGNNKIIFKIIKNTSYRKHICLYEWAQHFFLKRA